MSVLLPCTHQLSILNRNVVTKSMDRWRFPYTVSLQERLGGFARRGSFSVKEVFAVPVGRAADVDGRMRT
jgi:hypothetical protein